MGFQWVLKSGKNPDIEKDDPCSKGEHVFIEDKPRVKNPNGTVSIIGSCKCGRTASRIVEDGE